jgi:Mn2+/Fe2+ NRAMP family transporter
MQQNQKTNLEKWSLASPKKTLIGILGPSFLVVALSINGGELLLWPDLINKFGFSLIWMIPIILLLQYGVNMEIARYSAVTGKSTLEGLLSLNKAFAWLFSISILVSLVWPAWVSTAGNMTAFLFGLNSYGPLFAIFIMLGLILIWQNKASYRILENTSRYGLITVLGIVAWTVFSRWEKGLLSQLLAGFGNFGYLPENVNKFSLLSALAFGGVVGVLNLAWSEWIITKKYGVAGNSDPNLVNWKLIKSKNSWRKWYRLLLQEHFLLFYLGNFVGITLLAVLAFLTVQGQNISGFSILTTQYTIIKQTNLFTGTAFGIGIILIFTMAQMTILDAMGRLLKITLKTKLSSNQVSQICASIGILILAITYIQPSFNQPAILLQISACLSAMVMVLYTPFLLILNNKLPYYTRPKFWNKFLVIGCTVFYTAIILWLFL